MSIRALLALLLALSLGACASTGGGASTADEPSVLKLAPEEIPAEVRAIETLIDTKSALVADQVEIHVSRNYEWDVSLVGDKVEPQRPDGEDHVSVAHGHARAMFRNLDIRAYDRIVFRKSGFDVVPFIKVTARGSALYILAPEGEPPQTRRARVIRIDNAQINFEGENELPGSRGGRPALGPRVELRNP